MGSVKQILRCPEKSINVKKIARGSYKAAVTGGQIPEPLGIGSRELLARQLRPTNQNSSQ